MSARSSHSTSLPAPAGYGWLLVSALFILLSVGVFNLIDRQLEIDSTRTVLTRWLLHPGDAWIDSWAPMLDALDWLHERHDGTVYQTIFFQQHIKFQYPPTSLLPFAAMEAVGITPTPILLNELNWIWIAITAVAMAVFCVTLAERSGAAAAGDLRLRALTALTAVVATLTFFPVMIAYSLGQEQTWINAVFTLTALAWIYDRRLAAGALVGAICLLKPQFAVFLLWAILRRQWPFLLGWCVVVAVGGVASIALFGLANNLDYLSVVRFLGDRGETHYYNQSVNGLLNRLISPADSLGSDQGLPTKFPDHSALVSYGTLLSSLALIAAALLLRGRKADRGGLLDFMTAALTFTIASPIAWIHHYGIILPIFAALLFALLARGAPARDWGVWAVLAISYAIAANLIYPANFTANTPFNFIQSDLFFAGLALLWLLYRVSSPPRFEGASRGAPDGRGSATAGGFAAPTSAARR